MATEEAKKKQPVARVFPTRTTTGSRPHPSRGPVSLADAIGARLKGEAEQLFTHVNSIGRVYPAPDGATVAFVATDAPAEKSKELAEKGFKAVVYEESVLTSKVWMLDLATPPGSTVLPLMRARVAEQSRHLSGDEALDAAADAIRNALDDLGHPYQE